MRKWGALAISYALLVTIATPLNAAEEIITLDNLDPIRTSQVAFKNVNDAIDVKSSKGVVPTLFISEAAKKLNTDLKLIGMNRISTLWADLLPTSTLPVVIFTETDGAWVDQKQIELTGRWLRDTELQSERMKKYGCYIAGMYLPGVLFFCIKNEISANNISYADSHTFAHEYTHFMEMNVKNWIGGASGTTTGKRNSCWIEEGFATFYGFAVGASPNDPTGAKRRQFLFELLYNFDDNRKQPHGTLKVELARGDVGTIKSLFAMLENTPWPCDETQNAYALGSLAAEALVASFGQDRMVKFYLSSASTGDWRKSFQAVFGLSIDSFYEKLTPYIASQFTERNFEVPVPVATSLPKPTEAPTSAPIQSVVPIIEVKKTPVPKKTTITCIKGKTTKKVTRVNPKCPSGYKKK